MSDDRPRKSWREKDRQKDRSAHRTEEPHGGQGSGRYQRSQKSYRATLDRLFDSGKIGKLLGDESSTTPGGAERLELLKAIKAAEGRPAVTQAIDSYLQKFELPDDIEVLGKLLEHRDEAIQFDGMRRLREALTESKPRRSRGIIGQLKLIREMSEDDEATALAGELIETLGG